MQGIQFFFYHTWEDIPFQDQVTIADIISVAHVQAFLEFQDWNMY